MNRTDFRQIATALVGALILSTTSIVAAVGPARAATLSSDTVVTSHIAAQGIGRAM